MKRGLVYLSVCTIALSIVALLHNLEYVANFPGITWKRLQPEGGGGRSFDSIPDFPKEAVVRRMELDADVVGGARENIVDTRLFLRGGQDRKISMVQTDPVTHNSSTAGADDVQVQTKRLSDAHVSSAGSARNTSENINVTRRDRRVSLSSEPGDKSAITDDVTAGYNGSERNTRLPRAPGSRPDEGAYPEAASQDKQKTGFGATALVTGKEAASPGEAAVPSSQGTKGNNGGGLYKFKKVLLLSYQRSGSTVVGDVLFDRNPDVMYTYEPLDALYCSMYGTEPGWNVPADITITPFGELRPIPEFELNAVSVYLSNLLSCKFSEMPAEYFIHPFWYSFSNHTDSTKPYTSCLKKNAVSYKALYFCQRHIIFLCGKRFGDARSRRNVCSNQLLPQRKSRQLLYTHVRRGMGGHGERFHDIALAYPRIMGSKKPLEGYKMCLTKYTNRASTCIASLLPEICSRNKVHAIKTVRGTMAAADQLLQEHPDFFLIHLVRDPRGVVASRRKSGWSQGFYGRGKVRALAKSYCTTVLADIKHRKQLEVRYPGRIHSVVLDRFFENPKSHVLDIYAKVGLPAPADLSNYLNYTIKAGVADKWKEKLSRMEINDITNECSDLYREIIH